MTTPSPVTISLLQVCQLYVHLPDWTGLPVHPVCHEVGHLPVLCWLGAHHDNLCHPLCARNKGMQNSPACDCTHISCLRIPYLARRNSCSIRPPGKASLGGWHTSYCAWPVQQAGTCDALRMHSSLPVGASLLTLTGFCYVIPVVSVISTLTVGVVMCDCRVFPSKSCRRRSATSTGKIQKQQQSCYNAHQCCWRTG